MNLKEENEKLRQLLREIRPTIPREVLELWCKDRDAALSQQSEPTPGERAAWIDNNVRGNPTLIQAMKNLAGCGEVEPAEPTPAQTAPQPEQSGLLEAESAIRKFESANWHGSKGYHAGLLKAADIVAALSAQGSK